MPVIPSHRGMHNPTGCRKWILSSSIGERPVGQFVDRSTPEAPCRIIGKIPIRNRHRYVFIRVAIMAIYPLTVFCQRKIDMVFIIYTEKAHREVVDSLLRTAYVMDVDSLCTGDIEFFSLFPFKMPDQEVIGHLAFDPFIVRGRQNFLWVTHLRRTM